MLLGILVAIEVSTLTWALGALLASLGIAFLLKGFAGTRGSATVAVGTTVLGTAWIGFGLGFVLLLRDIPEHGRLASFTVLIAVFAGDTLAYAVGRTLGPPQARADALAGQDVGGVHRRDGRPPSSPPSSLSTRTATTSSRSARRSCSGS